MRRVAADSSARHRRTSRGVFVTIAASWSIVNAAAPAARNMIDTESSAWLCTGLTRARSSVSAPRRSEVSTSSSVYVRGLLRAHGRRRKRRESHESADREATQAATDDDPGHTFSHWLRSSACRATYALQSCGFSGRITGGRCSFSAP